MAIRPIKIDLRNAKISYQATIKTDNLIDQNTTQFVQNQGQLDLQIKYYFRQRDFDVFFAKEKIIFLSKNPQNEPDTFCIAFQDPNPHVSIQGEDQIIEASQTKNPKTRGSIYKKIRYINLWKGIDLLFYQDNENLRHQFIFSYCPSLENTSFK